MVAGYLLSRLRLDLQIGLGFAQEDTLFFQLRLKVRVQSCFLAYQLSH